MIAAFGTGKAQVGINLSTPQGAFHVNGTLNDVNNTNVTDDVIISRTTGNVGIGLINPTVKLDVKTTGTAASPVSGFKLADGSEGTGKVLYSNATGVASWQNLKLFSGSLINGTFTWNANTNLGNTAWNSISSVSVTPGTHMIYLKVHMLNTPSTGFLRTYVGTKSLGTNNSNAQDTPVFGSTNFQPYISRDFELTQSFIYTNSGTSNITLYFNIQSDSGTVQRSNYTYPTASSFGGVNLIENYFLAMPVN